MVALKKASSEWNPGLDLYSDRFLWGKSIRWSGGTISRLRNLKLFLFSFFHFVESLVVRFPFSHFTYWNVTRDTGRFFRGKRGDIVPRCNKQAIKITEWYACIIVILFSCWDASVKIQWQVLSSPMFFKRVPPISHFSTLSTRSVSHWGMFIHSVRRVLPLNPVQMDSIHSRLPERRFWLSRIFQAIQSEWKVLFI